MWVRSQGGEDPLEEGLETHSSILAWEILWTEESVQRCHKELGITEQLNTHTLTENEMFETVLTKHYKNMTLVRDGLHEHPEVTMN